MISINKKSIYFIKYSLFVWLGVFIFISCSKKPQLLSPLFQSLDSSQTQINFINQLKPTAQFNLFSYMYYYNGAGVGAGDFNNDGLIDLFFTANQGNNKLYLNKGALKFEDVTVKANIPQDSGWNTGVSVVDINNDGMLDIYICKVSHKKIGKSINQLLVCKGIDKQGIPFYEDEAAAVGLAFSGYSTQAVFFDYDGDTDLDMFLLNHSVNHDGRFAPRKFSLNTVDSLAGQMLYRNDTIEESLEKEELHFTDVTKQAGINSSRISYGLGVAVADINLDGWLDFYVGNDFYENDYLYINQKNGTFSEENSKRLMHTSQFSMGVDVADVNNDAYPEIISVDMLPYDPNMLRRSLGEDDNNTFQQKIFFGYTYQYSRNNLQLNRRNGMFSETGQYSGIAASDWSWAPLWLDFDNDGAKDLFISNGIPKRMNDIDYINFISSDEVQQKMIDKSMDDNDMSLLNKFPEIKIPNKFYYNTRNLLFKEVTDSIKNKVSTFSNGAIYADLDNDGDLDIVVNNINDPALIYENKANDKKDKTWASIKLKGTKNNINAIGAKIILFAEGEIRTYENHPVHGFLSSMLLPIHIGLYHTKIDSAFLIWPDNSFQPIKIKANEQVTFTYAAGLPPFKYEVLTSFYKSKSQQVEDITKASELNYVHLENPFNEFNRDQLLPRMLSAEGPALAIADINHDGLEDIFIGSSRTFHNAIYLQNTAGKFSRSLQPAMMQDSLYENVDVKWVDVNNDNHIDLVIATGGNENFGKDPLLLPLLYLNDGKGNFTKKADAFSNIYTTQSSVAVNDFNGDGFQDLFLGGRTEPWNYGKIPRSFLLQNDGTGRFMDVTLKYSNDLLLPGMVTNAKWVDIDKDRDPDLLLCYDWGGIDAFINNKNSFSRKVVSNKKGWWNFLLPCDLDKDGDMDFVAGNFGLNNKFKASVDEPVSLYYNDFDENGKKEQLLTYYLQGKEIPFATKQDLEIQLPFLKKKFLYAADFAKSSIKELVGKDKIRNAEKLTANYFSNAVFINGGNGQFEAIALPWQVQLSSYKDAAVINANNDDLPDILLVGNYYENNVGIGRLDADFGTILINIGKGRFEAESLNGLEIKGQVRHIKPIEINKQKAFVIARNNDSAMVIKFKQE